MPESPDLSRRNFLRGRLFAGAAKVASAVAAPMAAMNQAVAAQAKQEAQVAPIAVKKSVFVVARDCLAYQRSFCSVCSEHCPVAGAIKVENGRPFIQADVCTACGICKDVCPAPRNAIRIMDDPGADPGAPGMGSGGGVAQFLSPTTSPAKEGP